MMQQQLHEEDEELMLLLPYQEDEREHLQHKVWEELHEELNENPHDEHHRHHHQQMHQQYLPQRSYDVDMTGWDDDDEARTIDHCAPVSV